VIFLILQTGGRREERREVKWESSDIPDITDGREEGGKEGGKGNLMIFLILQTGGRREGRRGEPGC
jgi:hypothetical protein